MGEHMGSERYDDFPKVNVLSRSSTERAKAEYSFANIPMASVASGKAEGRCYLSRPKWLFRASNGIS